MKRTTKLDAMTDVIAERTRQIKEEGFSRDRDDAYTKGELALAAASYLMWRHGDLEFFNEVADFGSLPKLWPWHPGWWKPKNYRRDLVRAGALILAEIERLDRAANKENAE